jgi:hypothetical protein
MHGRIASRTGGPTVNIFRNLFVFLCVVAVIGAFVYTARPQWFTGITASSRSAPAELVTQKATLILPVAGRGSPTSSGGPEIRHLIDSEDDGIPTRINPYLMVINTGEKTIRHYRLTANVKSVSLRLPNSDVVVKKSRSLNSDAPIQLEFWIPYERELTLDVEYTMLKR